MASGCGAGSSRPSDLESYFCFSDIEEVKGFPARHMRQLMRPGCSEKLSISLITKTLPTLTKVILTETTPDGKKTKKWVLAKDHPDVKVVNFFDRPTPPYQMTPLMVLAARGYNKAIKLLLGEVNLNAQDKFGWSAAHYAAAMNQVGVFSILREAGIDLTLLNNRNGTAEEIHKLAYPTKGILLKNGATYCPFVECSAETLIQDRYTPVVPLELSPDEEENQKLANRLYAEGSKSYQVSYHKKVGYCASLKSAVESGESLWFYAGKIIPESKGRDFSHTIQCGAILNGVPLQIDGREVCNAGPLMPDGMPTVLYVFVKSLHGAPFAIFCKAMCYMPAGAVPLAHYGKEHRVKNKWCDLVPDYTRARLKDITSARVGDGLVRLQSLFILETVPLFFKLLAEGEIDFDNISKLSAYAMRIADETGRDLITGFIVLLKALAETYSKDEVKAIFARGYERIESCNTQENSSRLLAHIHQKNLAAKDGTKLTPDQFVEGFKPKASVLKS